jgi:hypothetical protein
MRGAITETCAVLKREHGEVGVLDELREMAADCGATWDLPIPNDEAIDVLHGEVIQLVALAHCFGRLRKRMPKPLRNDFSRAMQHRYEAIDSQLMDFEWRIEDIKYDAVGKEERKAAKATEKELDATRAVLDKLCRAIF